MTLALLPAAERRAVPWKDGGGLTFPVAVFPAHAGFDNFVWRVSLAEVIKPGPFSSFPGVDRVLTVLSGRMRLASQDFGCVWLDAMADPFPFSGDATWAADQVAEPVIDLNVMTRRGVCQAEVRRIPDLKAAGSQVFREAALVIALSPSHLIFEGVSYPLEPLDAVVLEGATSPVSGAGTVVVVRLNAHDENGAAKPSYADLN